MEWYPRVFQLFSFTKDFWELPHPVYSLGRGEVSPTLWSPNYSVIVKLRIRILPACGRNLLYEHRTTLRNINSHIFGVSNISPCCPGSSCILTKTGRPFGGGFIMACLRELKACVAMLVCSLGSVLLFFILHA